MLIEAAAHAQGLPVDREAPIFKKNPGKFAPKETGKTWVVRIILASKLAPDPGGNPTDPDVVPGMKLDEFKDRPKDFE